MKNFFAVFTVVLIVTITSFACAQALFEEHTIQENFKQTISVYAIDLDKDSDIDVLDSAYEDNTIAWWENDGSQNFTVHIVSDNFNGVRTIWADDLDKEGDMDVLGVARYGNKISWFENIDQFIVADFTAKPISGHAPLTVQFKDSSYTKPGTTSRQRDFDNDGTIDSQDQNPKWTFELPGIYTVRLIVTNNSRSDTLMKEDLIHVFDGESTLLFDGKNGCATCSAAPILKMTDAVTIKAWIKPSGWGSLQNLGFGRIIDKKNVLLLLNEEGGSLNCHSLATWFSTDSGSSSTRINISLPKPVRLKLNIYDMNGGLVKSFFNGQIWQSGIHSIEWEGTDNGGNLVSSGLYFYKITADNFTDLKKAILIK